MSRYLIWAQKLFSSAYLVYCVMYIISCWLLLRWSLECVINAGRVFDDELPGIITIASGETVGTSYIAVSNDASLAIGSTFIIALTSVQLRAG